MLPAHLLSLSIQILVWGIYLIFRVWSAISNFDFEHILRIETLILIRSADNASEAKIKTSCQQTHPRKRTETKGFKEKMTKKVNGQRLSFGMTPKTRRQPKPGELMLSVHASPLGVFEEDQNMGAINEESL